MKRLKDVNKKEINKVIIYTRRVLPPPSGKLVIRSLHTFVWNLCKNAAIS